MLKGRLQIPAWIPACAGMTLPREPPAAGLPCLLGGAWLAYGSRRRGAWRRNVRGRGAMG